MNFASNAVWVLIAYLIGSIPTGYLVTKRARGIDIREHGSGNVGATNVLRVAGKGWASLVLTLDFLKGWVVTAILAPTAPAFPDLSVVLRQLLFGFAAIAGHTWTPWLGLKGGKGIAASAGALLGIFPFASILATLIWALVLTIKRYVSLASIVAAGSFPILLLFFYPSIESFWTVFAISAALAGLLIYNHRANIERLRRGEELPVTFGKNKKPSSSP